VPSSTSTFDKLKGAARFAGGVLAAVLTLELFFRALPVSTSTETGYYFDPLLLTYPAHHPFTSATGWELQNARRNHANNFGYLADHDFVRDSNAIALIGDSFVEGSMLTPPNRFAARLEARLSGARPVYALGAPGTALLDYAERLRFASERFGIHDFVLLLEHGDVAQALCGSGNIQAQCLDGKTLAPRIEKHAPAGMFKRLLRRSALAQYLFSQLKVNPAVWVRSLLRGHSATAASAPPAHDSPKIPSEVVQRVLDEFFARTEAYRNGGTLILVIMGDQQDDVTMRLVETARLHGATLIEAEPLLRAETKRSGLSMHVSPNDAHLNGQAFRVLSDAVARALSARANVEAGVRQ
jgi:hypothetical protein